VTVDYCDVTSPYVCLSDGSFCSKVIVQTDTHTRQMEFSPWTTKGFETREEQNRTVREWRRSAVYL